MNRHFLLALCLAASVTSTAEAQTNVARYGERANWVYANYGLDPAFVATVGYGRRTKFFGHPVQFTIDGGVVTTNFRPDIGDFRGRLQARSTVLRWKPLRLTGSIAFLTRGTENSIYRGLTFGSDFTGTAGLYLRRWHAAFEFGFDKDVITYVKNTDWYRTNFYPDARDGWYLNAGGSYHYGFNGSVSFGPAELNVRAGMMRTQKWEAMTPPVYASVGMGVAF